MEEINEIKGWLWSHVTATKKKNLNVISKISSNQSILVKNRLKKIFGWRHETNCKLVERRTIKIIDINALK